MLKITQIPVLSDNYIYILSDGSEMAVIDPALAQPVSEFLSANNLKLKYILNTHHHNDHIGGNLELKTSGVKVYGFGADSARIPGIDIHLKDNEEIEILGSRAKVMFVPGHTLGHIAYYFPAEKALFCGDTIFSLGCGRLFEGTPAQMFESLARLKALPDDTMIYCAHEYTESNARFAITVEPDNADLKERIVEVKSLRARGVPTIPVSLGEEKLTNPFLRARDANEFAAIRKAKDNF